MFGLHYMKISISQEVCHPELSGCITTLIEVANFGAAMDTLIDQDGSLHDAYYTRCTYFFIKDCTSLKCLVDSYALQDMQHPIRNQKICVCN